MSRSYKHEPTCGGKNKFCKNQANRRVRRNKIDLELSKGGYKKVYCSWEICDYFSRCTWEEYWESKWRSYLWWLDYNPNSRWAKEPNYEESYRDWWRAYNMK
jgi:hypothetical protein